MKRLVILDILLQLQNSEQFTATFNKEANFCTGFTQIYIYSPTYIKYSMTGPGRKQDLYQFKTL